MKGDASLAKDLNAMSRNLEIMLFVPFQRFRKVNMKNLNYSCFNKSTVLFFIAIVGSAHAGRFTPTYSVTEFPILPGYAQEVVSDLNNRADAVGTARSRA